MTLAQLLTLLYDRKLPQGYQSINLTVRLGSKIISDPGLSKTDSFKRLRTEKGTEGKRPATYDHLCLLSTEPSSKGPVHSEAPLHLTTRHNAPVGQCERGLLLERSFASVNK